MEQNFARINRQLQEEKERYHSLFEHHPDAVFSFDCEGNFQSANKAAAKLTETTLDNLLTFTFEPFIAEKDRQRVIDLFKRTVDGDIQHYSCNLVTASGNHKTIEVTNIPIVVDEEIIGVYGIAKDVTKKIETERLHKKAYELARIGTWDFDMKTHELNWSTITKQVHGFGPDYQPELESTINLFKEGIHRERFAKAARNAIEHEQPFDVEQKIISGQGDERWIRAVGEPEYKDGTCTRFYGISQNISKRKQAEQRYISLFAFNPLPMWIIEQETLRILDVNQAAIDHYGYSKKEFITMSIPDLKRKEDVENTDALLQKVEDDDLKHEYYTKHVKKDGEVIDVKVTAKNIHSDGTIVRLALAEDITDHRKQEEKIRLSLKEKETLLAEIHHRVKNNLAVVSAMMQLQAFEEEDVKIKTKLLNSMTRIQSIANIHEHLYQSNSFANLDFSANLKHLVSNIINTFHSGKEIEVDLQLESVQLNVNQAIPTSLIANEVITNILKHAFTGKSTGIVHIELFQREDKVQLNIIDNGIGLPDDFHEASDNSLGLLLIKNLAQQLEGDYQYQSAEEGSEFLLNFKKADVKGVGNSFF